MRRALIASLLVCSALLPTSAQAQVNFNFNYFPAPNEVTLCELLGAMATLGSIGTNVGLRIQLHRRGEASRAWAVAGIALGAAGLAGGMVGVNYWSRNSSGAVVAPELPVALFFSGVSAASLILSALGLHTVSSPPFSASLVPVLGGTQMTGLALQGSW